MWCAKKFKLIYVLYKRYAKSDCDTVLWKAKQNIPTHKIHKICLLIICFKKLIFFTEKTDPICCRLRVRWKHELLWLNKIQIETYPGSFFDPLRFFLHKKVKKEFLNTWTKSCDKTNNCSRCQREVADKLRPSWHILRDRGLLKSQWSKCSFSSNSNTIKKISLTRHNVNKRWKFTHISDIIKNAAQISWNRGTNLCVID